MNDAAQSQTHAYLKAWSCKYYIFLLWFQGKIKRGVGPDTYRDWRLFIGAHRHWRVFTRKFGSPIILIGPALREELKWSLTKHEKWFAKWQQAFYMYSKEPIHGFSKCISELKTKKHRSVQRTAYIPSTSWRELLFVGGTQRLYKPMMSGKGRQ